MGRRRRRGKVLRAESLEPRWALSALPVSSVSLGAEAAEASGEPLTIQFRLEVTDTAGVPQTAVEVGEPFHLRAYVQDLRGASAAGVFSAYLDVAYDASLAVATGPVSFGGEYTNARSGNGSVPGLIDEVGAFGSVSGFDQGDQEFFLWSIPMVATDLGSLSFVGNPADDQPHHDLYHYDDLNRVEAADVDYGQATVTILPPSNIVVDDGDAGFTTSGAWVAYGGIGHQGDVRFNARGDGADVAAWQMPLFAGRYRVLATWSAHPNRATDAPYRLYADDVLLDEVRVNQEIAPSDRVFAGAAWDVLGTVNIVDQPLRVTLSDDANEFVIADGILLERLGDPLFAPELQLSRQGNLLTDGEVVDLGNHSVGTPVVERFEVTNTGTTNLSLSSLSGVSFPAGFRLAQDFGQTTLAPGETTDFRVEFVTTSPIQAAGTLTIPSNAGAFSIQLRGTAQETQPGAAVAQVLDDGDPGFTTQNQWTTYRGLGAEGDLRFSAAGSGSDTVRWSFDIAPGTYRVSATWPAHPNRATNAPYQITSGGAVIGAATKNQRIAPNDRVEEGISYSDLGIFTATGNDLVVELSDAGNGYVIADSVRIDPIGDPGDPPPPPAVQVLDNGDGGYVATGSWTRYVGIGAQGDVAFSAAGSGSDVAEFRFSVTPGTYRVSTTWAAHPNRATNAPYSLSDGVSLLTAVTRNQRVAPGTFVDGGIAWDDLGTVTVSTNSLVIELSDAANGYVIADAMRIERVS